MQLVAESSSIELIREKAGGVASSRHMSFPPTHSGDTTSASLPASEPVASLHHSCSLLSLLNAFEEQHQSHLTEPACLNSRQQLPSDPSGMMLPHAQVLL